MLVLDINQLKQHILRCSPHRATRVQQRLTVTSFQYFISTYLAQDLFFPLLFIKPANYLTLLKFAYVKFIGTVSLAVIDRL